MESTFLLGTDLNGVERKRTESEMEDGEKIKQLEAKFHDGEEERLIIYR